VLRITTRRPRRAARALVVEPVERWLALVVEQLDHEFELRSPFADATGAAGAVG
jgi:hypothetical protein